MSMHANPTPEELQAALIALAKLSPEELARAKAKQKQVDDENVLRSIAALRAAGQSDQQIQTLAQNAEGARAAAAGGYGALNLAGNTYDNDQSIERARIDSSYDLGLKNISSSDSQSAAQIAAQRAIAEGQLGLGKSQLAEQTRSNKFTEGVDLANMAGDNFNSVSYLDALARSGMRVPLNNPELERIKPIQFNVAGAAAGNTRVMRGGAKLLIDASTGQPEMTLAENGAERIKVEPIPGVSQKLDRTKQAEQVAEGLANYSGYRTIGAPAPGPGPVSVIGAPKQVGPVATGLANYSGYRVVGAPPVASAPLAPAPPPVSPAPVEGVVTGPPPRTGYAPLPLSDTVAPVAPLARRRRSNLSIAQQGDQFAKELAHQNQTAPKRQGVLPGSPGTVTPAAYERMNLSGMRNVGPYGRLNFSGLRIPGAAAGTSFDIIGDLIAQGKLKATKGTKAASTKTVPVDPAYKGWTSRPQTSAAVPATPAPVTPAATPAAAPSAAAAPAAPAQEAPEAIARMLAPVVRNSSYASLYPEFVAKLDQGKIPGMPPAPLWNSFTPEVQRRFYDLWKSSGLVGNADTINYAIEQSRPTGL